MFHRLKNPCCNRCSVTENHRKDGVKGTNTKWATNHIWRNPFLQTCDELMFCFPFSQSWSRLCFVKLTHPPSEPTVLLDSSPWGTMSDSLSTRVTFAVTAWMLSVVSSSSSPANTLPDIKNEDFIKDCVRMHNKFRSSVTPAASDMLYMVRKLQCLRRKSVKNKGCGLIWVVNPR